MKDWQYRTNWHYTDHMTKVVQASIDAEAITAMYRMLLWEFCDEEGTKPDPSSFVGSVASLVGSIVKLFTIPYEAFTKTRRSYHSSMLSADRYVPKLS